MSYKKYEIVFVTRTAFCLCYFEFCRLKIDRIFIVAGILPFIGLWYNTCFIDSFFFRYQLRSVLAFIIIIVI